MTVLATLLADGASVQDLETRVQQAVMKRNQLVARYRSAEAMKSLEQELGRTGGGGQALDRLESRAADSEAQAAAYHELSRDSLEDRFAQLEQGTSVDSELAALKQQRGAGVEKPPQLGSGER